MKKTILLLMLLSIYANGFTQVANKKGFFGVSLGPSMYTGSNIQFSSPSIIPSSSDPSITAGSVGFNYSFIDAGYTIENNWGVAVKLQGGIFTNKSDRKVLKSNFGAILLGPMYSLEIHDDLIIDFKLKGGRFFNVLDYTDEFAISTRISNFDFGVEFGASTRYHISDNASWINSLDFQNQFGGNGTVNRFNLSTGIAFRF